MWIFCRLGFYSIACANSPDGSIDRDTVMIRARQKEHLQNLRDRFPALADAEIITTPNRDYRYRLIVSKQVWVQMLSDMAEEQTWSNFKNAVAAYQGKRGTAYTTALHKIWAIMCELQRSAN